MPVQRGHDCGSPVSFSVDGFGIPVIDDGVTVHEQKDGPMSINRRAEVTFPIESNEHSWVSEIDAFQEGGGIEIADVGMRPVDINGNPAGSRRTIIRGYISGVGSRGAANSGRVRILGPFKLLSSIPVETKFENDGISVNDVLSWFTDEFESGQNIFDSVTFSTEVVDDDIRTLPDFDDGGLFSESAYGFPKLTENRDTLADATQLIIEKLGLSVWFEPDPDNDSGIILRANLKENMATENYDLTGDSDIPLISNDSIYEMQPFNAIELRGEKGVDINVGDSVDVTIPGSTLYDNGSFPIATAVYEPLKERVGERITKVAQSKLNRVGPIENEAESRLKSMLDSVSGGTMDTALAPQVRPFDTVTAKPACATIVETDVPELKFEVQRTAHTLAPKNDENEIPQTELSVSMNVNPNNITTTSTRSDTQPSDGSDNEPPANSFGGNDGLFWGVIGN